MAGSESWTQPRGHPNHPDRPNQLPQQSTNRPIRPSQTSQNRPMSQPPNTSKLAQHMPNIAQQRKHRHSEQAPRRRCLFSLFNQGLQSLNLPQKIKKPSKAPQPSSNVLHPALKVAQYRPKNRLHTGINKALKIWRGIQQLSSRLNILKFQFG